MATWRKTTRVELAGLGSCFPEVEEIRPLLAALTAPSPQIYPARGSPTFTPLFKISGAVSASALRNGIYECDIGTCHRAPTTMSR